MTSSILATDKYKLVMALAGAPLRPETFVFMLRRGGPFFLPVDIEAYVQTLLPAWSDEADAWLAEHGMRMDSGWREALASSVTVQALPRGAWFGDREVVATITGPSALVSWLEPQLIWLQFRIQVATMARLDPGAARTRLAVATCETEAEIIRELLDDAELSGVNITADPDGYRDFVQARAKRALEAVDGPLLYARVDVAPGPDGCPVLMELELIEPSLFFPQCPRALDCFVAGIRHRLGDSA